MPPKPAERIFQRFICMFDSSGLSRLTAYLIWENRELDRLIANFHWFLLVILKFKCVLFETKITDVTQLICRNALQICLMSHCDFPASPGWTYIVCWKMESWPSIRMPGTTTQHTTESLLLTLVTARLIRRWDTRRRKMSSSFSKNYSYYYGKFYCQ